MMKRLNCGWRFIVNSTFVNVFNFYAYILFNFSMHLITLVAMTIIERGLISGRHISVFSKLCVLVRKFMNVC